MSSKYPWEVTELLATIEWVYRNRGMTSKADTVYEVREKVEKGEMYLMDIANALVDIAEDEGC
jgi:hypothetical protein